MACQREREDLLVVARQTALDVPERAQKRSVTYTAAPRLTSSYAAVQSCSNA